MDWMPIETAPKDDVLILGWWCKVLNVTSWECEIEYFDGDHCATHWMPLPAPPQDAPNA